MAEQEQTASAAGFKLPKAAYIGIILLLAGMIAAIVLLQIKAGAYAGEAVDNGIHAAKTAYADAKEQAKADAYGTYSEKAKAQYQVTAHADISIERVQETAELNVLECQTSDYFYRDDAERKLTACLKVTGSGKYKVNLQNAEYCVDQERCAVYIRLPQPVFEYTGETDEESLYFNKESVQIGPIEIGDGSTQEGRNLLDALREEASEKLAETLCSEAELKYPETARESAKKLLTELVKAANPEVPEIQIEISFVGEE